MAVRIFAFVDTHRFQRLVGGQRGIFLYHSGVEVFQPLLLRAPFGEALVNIRPKAAGDLAGDPVDAFALELRRGDWLQEDEVAHVAGVVVGDNILLLNGHQIRQQDVGVHRRRGHKVLNYHDRLALALIL